MGFFSFFCFLFTTQVEQFWGFYSYLVRPGDLTGHSDIHLFKDGIKPMWEVGYLFLSFKKMEHLSWGANNLILIQTVQFNIL